MGLGILLKALAALMLAFIWTVYLRKVNIFTRIKWPQIIFPLLVGALSTIVVIKFNLPDITTGINPKNDMLLRFIEYTYSIALLEETCKYGAFLVVMIIWLLIAGTLHRKSLVEEPNIIIYASLVALGFATVENYFYIEKSGFGVVYMRGIMSTVSHIVATTIIAGFMIVGYRKSVFRAMIYSLGGLVIAVLMHGLYDFFLSFGLHVTWVVTVVIFSIQIEVWARILNNFLNFSRRIYLNKCLDRNLMQLFLLIMFLAAGMVQLFGLIYEEGVRKGILTHLNLLSMELIITLILIIRITRFTIIPRYWQRVLPVLPITIRRGKFQRSIIPTSPRFFLKIRGDEFNEYPFTSRIDDEIKLKMDFDTDVKVKMITKKFIGPRKDLYYLCEVLDFHTIHPQFNSRYILIRPKNYGVKSSHKNPLVGLIALKGFVDLENIHPKDCKFMDWVIMEKKGGKSFGRRILEMMK